MFMKIEAAPLIFLITILSLVMLIQQIGAGGAGVTAQKSEQSVAQPTAQLAAAPLSGWTVEKESGAQVALLRTPIALEQTALPQR